MPRLADAQLQGCDHWRAEECECICDDGECLAQTLQEERKEEGEMMEKKEEEEEINNRKERR